MTIEHRFSAVAIRSRRGHFNSTRRLLPLAAGHNRFLFRPHFDGKGRSLAPALPSPSRPDSSAVRCDIGEPFSGGWQAGLALHGALSARRRRKAYHHLKRRSTAPCAFSRTQRVLSDTPEAGHLEPYDELRRVTSHAEYGVRNHISTSLDASHSCGMPTGPRRHRRYTPAHPSRRSIEPSAERRRQWPEYWYRRFCAQHRHALILHACNFSQY